MKKLIVKTNEWYENLSDMKRLSFFLIVIMGSLIVAQYFMYARNFIWAFPIWAGTICFWRCGYVFINWHEWYKKTHSKQNKN